MSSNAKQFSAKIWNEPQAEVVPLSTAVFCLDCEAISNSRGDECQGCKSRSVVNLARILGGSLGEQKLEPRLERGSFDLTLAIDLRNMHANDVNATLENLTNAIGPMLAQGRASFHIYVQPAVKQGGRVA
jgi:hypothetical protein